MIGVVIATHDTRKGWINRLAIDPDYRRRGYAQQLVQAAEDALRDLGLTLIAAMIEDYNDASLALFKRLGYAVHTDIYYVSKRDSSDCLIRGTMGQYYLLRHRDTPDIHKLSVYGEYAALKKAVTSMTADQVINEVKAAGLRGRGGAGFPTGVKWSFVPKDRLPHYVTVNADESEPGTFKDRELMEFNPHQVIEGAAIAAYAVGATRVYHYLRGEFKPVARKMQAAIDEAYAAGYLGKNIFGTDIEIQMFVHLGAGAYICGEESALLESLEGKMGQPRLRPPFPGARRVVWPADRHQQHRDDVERAVHHQQRRGRLQAVGHREKSRPQGLLFVGSRQAPRQLRSRTGQDHVPRFDFRRRLRAGHDDRRPQSQGDFAVGRLRSDRDGFCPRRAARL